MFRLNNKSCVLSINTTGINRHKNKLFLVNINFLENDKNTVQVFIDENNPVDSLVKIKELIKEYTLITYNGDSFDIPFINELFIKNGIEPLKNDCFDVLRFLKSYDFLPLENHKLQYVYEQFVKKDFCLLEQKDNIKIYKDYLKNSTDDLKDKLLEQGRLSVIYRYEILKSLENTLLENSIDFLAYDLNYKVVPYSYSITDSFLTVKLYNLSSRFYELNFVSDYFKIGSEKDFLILRYDITRGLIAQGVKGTCINCSSIFDLDENYDLINDDLVPIVVENKVDLPLIKKVVKDTLKNL